MIGNFVKKLIGSISQVMYQDSTDQDKQALGVVGFVNLIDTQGNPITSFGGISSGANDTHTTASGQISAVANSGGKTITLSGLPFTLLAEHVTGGSIKKIDTNGDVVDLPLTNVTVAGDIITLGDIDDFVVTDTVSVVLKAIEKNYDSNQDVLKSNRENPEYDHYTSIEHIIDTTNDTVDQHYSPEIFMESWRNLVIQLTGSSSTSGVTFKIYGTLNPDAATPSDGDAAPSLDWVDMSTDIFGAASVLLNGGNSGLYFVDTPTMLYKFIIQYEPDHATNSSDIFIRRS